MKYILPPLLFSIVFLAGLVAAAILLKHTPPDADMRSLERIREGVLDNPQQLV
jgi:hypothetical protein